jgi:hypothetical protein
MGFINLTVSQKSPHKSPKKAWLKSPHKTPKKNMASLSVRPSTSKNEEISRVTSWKDFSFRDKNSPVDFTSQASGKTP